jgi:hypothetical protein
MIWKARIQCAQELAVLVMLAQNSNKLFFSNIADQKGHPTAPIIAHVAAKDGTISTVAT